MATKYYDIIQEAISGLMSIEDSAQKIGEMVAGQTDSIDMLADTLVQCDIETNIMGKERRDILINIIKCLLKESILPQSIVMERFEIDTLVPLLVIQDKRQFTVSYNRLRTKLYFKQKKYNLLREENEGFARVITELAQLRQDNIKQVLSSVVDIIGAYLVDPNRVLDIVLELFEYNIRRGNNFYIEFLESFYNSPPKILSLIILKLSFFSSNKDDLRHVPQSLYRIIAVLIKKEVLDIDDIYPYLAPSDERIVMYHKDLVDEGKSIAKKYAMAVVGEDKPQSRTVIEKLEDLDRHVLETENQKLNLCAHLLDIGDWEHAEIIARKLPEFYCYSNRHTANAACNLIDYLIDPLYREVALPKPLNSRIRPISVRDGYPEQIKTVEELQERVFPMLFKLGPFISADTLLLTKLLRILRHLLLQKQDNQENLITSEKPLFYDIIDVIDISILPAMTLSGSNSSLARELWSIMKHLKYHIRYKLYFNWKDEGSNPIMLRNRGEILLRAKHHMKRLSKETLRFTARHVGKLCFSNPVITLNYILIQIQSYDNLIGLVVDALRFLPPLALDVLIYCIIEALIDPHKNKKSYDGMALAPWLTSLSSFSANIILRYKVEFTSFLEYIANQLKAGNSLDLVLLTDLIQKMTGIETIQAITDDRIEALMGGDVLRTEGAYFNQVKNTRKPSARLKDALIESRLAMPLCILMAQLRDSLFFNRQDESTPLKLTGKLYDQCQDTLVQYGVFLSTNLGIDDYINFLPPLKELLVEYRLDPDSAFFLARPMIFHKIRSKFNELKVVVTKDMPSEEGESPELPPQAAEIKFVEAARSVIDPIAEEIQPFLIEKYSASRLSAKLFVIFWTLSMSDIDVPINCYDREIAKLKMNVSEMGKGDEEPKKRKEKERCMNLIQKLKQEQADQIEHANYIKKYLESEKNNLFCENSCYDNVYLESRQFVQHCSFARCILTAYDAIYSARFMLFLHELKVLNYPTIICLDRLLCDLTYMMGACTENEANHYGRFLCNILKTTSYWHSSLTVYSEQCEQYPGSIINVDNSEYITYETYRDICYKWHYRLTRSFSVALESNNYIQIRNALIVMIKIIDYYPAIKHFGKGIGIKIEEVRNSEKESRQDLYALATAYAGRLEEKKQQLIPESNFHNITDVRGPQRERHSSSSSRKKARHN